MAIHWPLRRKQKLPVAMGEGVSIAFDENGRCFVLYRAQGSDHCAYSLWDSEQGISSETQLPESVRFPIIAPKKDGKFVVVDAICPWVPDNSPRHNAFVLDQSGKCLNSFHGGSSIMDVQCDIQNRIWISYFDEGVFGNHGWNSPGPSGLGSGGLVCLSEDGTLIWSHNNKDNDPERFIDDCYALNVIDRDAWFYFYSDFCLGQISDFGAKPIYHEVPISGSHAFAKRGQLLAFSAQYREEPTICHLMDTAGAAQSNARFADMSCAETRVMTRSNTLIKGRGQWMHLVAGDLWLAYNLDDIAV
jgi:hypothetical protein